MTPAIEVSHVFKRFVLRHSRSLKEAIVWKAKGRKGSLSEAFEALHDINLVINQGESVALLGHNGSGKSTLLKHISGVMAPDSGSVKVAGRVAGLIEMGAGFHPDLTGRENVFLNGAILGMSEKKIKTSFDDIMNFSEIEKFIDNEVKFYSSGMYLRLAFSLAVHTNPDIFLIDEILAVGDEPFQKKCLQKIRELSAEGKTLIVVSHDLNKVASLCNRGVVMSAGHITYTGSIDTAIERLRAQEKRG